MVSNDGLHVFTSTSEALGTPGKVNLWQYWRGILGYIWLPLYVDWRQDFEVF